MVKSLPNLWRCFLMADKNLVCKDCGKEFVFTEGEQAFYKEKGFENEPQRCPDCRRAKKAERRQNDNRGFRR
jgi:DNA-directed RNA polymerase subunit RPC12/RpoP